MHFKRIILLMVIIITINSCVKVDDSVCPACPTITNIIPGSASFDDTIQLIGNHLLPDLTKGDSLQLKINNVPIPASYILKNTATSITLIVPKAIGSGKVSVDINVKDGLVNHGDVNFTYNPKWIVSTLAGTGNHGYADNSDPLSAMFKTIVDITVDPSNNDLYVLESDKVRKISFNGGVSTVMTFTPTTESAIACGRDDGIFLTYKPNNCKISMIDHSMGVNTFLDYAGQAGNCVDVSNVPIANAGFSNLNDIVIDFNMNKYVADGNSLKLITNTNVYKIAGSTTGYSDGDYKTAQFSEIKSIDVDPKNGDIYIADFLNHRIRKLSGNTVFTVAGIGYPTFINGPVATASLSYPNGLACDIARNIYFTEGGHYAIRKIDLNNGVVSTFAGMHHDAGSMNGDAMMARFNNPTKLAFNRALNTLYIVDSSNYKIRQMKFE